MLLNIHFGKLCFFRYFLKIKKLLAYQRSVLKGKTIWNKDIYIIYTNMTSKASIFELLSHLQV